MHIYRKAVGARLIFFTFYRFYNSILPSVNAILAGATVTAISEAVTTHNIMPTVIFISVLLGVQLVDAILGAINRLLSIRNYQDVYIYVSEQVASKYIQIPLATRESREFADKFARVKEFANSIPTISSNIIGVVSAVISLVSVMIATLTVSPIIVYQNPQLGWGFF